MQHDYFTLLGLPRAYHVDARTLEERYHERSKLHHPDRHVRADGVTRVKNALATSELNQAYRALRDPVQRAEYLLKLNGIDVSDEKSGQVAPDFLMEMMELRERLAEARAGRDEREIGALAADVRARRDAALAGVGEGFARGDLAAVAEALVALRYFRRFLDEIEAYEDARAEENAKELE